jgi:transcriptional regulator with XRE-family HTH domain
MFSTMIKPLSRERQRQLGDFVRARREKLTPEMLGLPASGRRRTPGLRREEAAQLCGLSVTWYTWLEQGRDVSVSPMALARLADALRLGHAERAYLFELAERRDPDEGDESTNTVQPAVIASLKAIDAPAYLLDGGWNALGWNEQAERLFIGWLDRPGERNLLRYIFLEPAARALIPDYDDRSRRVVAEFRANVRAHLEDARVRALTEELRMSSPWFAQLWDAQSVQSREGGMRTFNHPQDGFRRYEQVTFNVVSRPELKLTILLPSEAL